MNRITLLLFCFIPLLSGAQEKTRADILKRMHLVFGDFPGREHVVEPDLKVIATDEFDDYTRQKITFATEKHDRVPAYILMPKKFPGKRPLMLCLHQTTGIGKGEPAGLNKDQNKHYALELVKRGYICFVPDYPSFGDYQYDFKKSAFASGSLKAVWNNMRGIDMMIKQPNVDAERIGTIGHSLGGHHSMFTAAFDERIKVTVSCCGFCGFGYYYKGNLKGWDQDRYMPRVRTEYSNDPKKMPFDFDDVVLAFAPRAFFAVAPVRDDNFSVDGVRDVFKKIVPALEKQKITDHFKVIYPDSAHDFPTDSRKQAYEFIDKYLKP